MRRAGAAAGKVAKLKLGTAPTILMVSCGSSPQNPADPGRSRRVWFRTVTLFR